MLLEYKVTEWFPCTKKPTIQGYYEVFRIPACYQNSSYKFVKVPKDFVELIEFDGRVWRYESSKSKSVVICDIDMWRGLTEESYNSMISNDEKFWV